MVVKRHEFKFSKLANIERGIFIIEFIGNGITSRASKLKYKLKLYNIFYFLYKKKINKFFFYLTILI